MINVIVRWTKGAPTEFKPGQFIVYTTGEWELVGSREPIQTSRIVLKYATLIEGHELEWLQSMAVERSLGVTA